MSDKKHKSLLTLAHQHKRKLDGLATSLISKIKHEDPNQALMVMASLGLRLFRGHSSQVSKGLAKFAGQEGATGDASKQAWALEKGLKPEEVVFGENVFNVGDLANEPASAFAGKPGISEEETYAKLLLNFNESISELNRYEELLGIELTPFNFTPSKTRLGRPAAKGIEVMDAELAAGFTRIKREKKAGRPVPTGAGGKTGRPVTEKYLWWSEKAGALMTKRVAISKAELEIVEPIDAVKRGMVSNRQIINLCKLLKRSLAITNPKASLEFINKQERQAKDSLDMLEKIKANSSGLISKDYWTTARYEMLGSSKRKYQLLIDDLKARMPADFSSGKVYSFFDTESRAGLNIANGIELAN